MCVKKLFDLERVLFDLEHGLLFDLERGTCMKFDCIYAN